MVKKLSYIIFLIFIFSFSKISSNSLQSSEINIIEKNFINGLITYNYTIGHNERAYFSYDISGFQDTKMVFTIHNSIEERLDIKCIQSQNMELEDLIAEFNSGKNNCSAFVTLDFGIINVIVNISETKANPNLYLYIYNSNNQLQSNLTLFIRENLGYKRELKTEEILNPVAYTVYEIDPLEYYYNKTDYLTFNILISPICHNHLEYYYKIRREF